MTPRILFVTPPFTQLNTPYPATAYLKGYLQTLGIASEQADWGLEVILRLFSADGLSRLFGEAASLPSVTGDERLSAMLDLRERYVATIEPVVAFLQGRDPSLAHAVCSGEFLPVPAEPVDEEELEWAFGTMGLQDRARHLATLYIEDISRLVTAVDPHFGLSRYAEQLGRSASSFDALHDELQNPATYIDRILFSRIEERFSSAAYEWVALTVPFPGNLYSALRCGQYIKQHFPDVRVCLGGGFVTTELRQLTDARLFGYVDYILLDDGELPLRQLLTKGESDWVRTFALRDGRVEYLNNPSYADIPMRERGVPDYTGLPLDRYLSVIELTNPMHSLWSNGRWNKLTLAHGCYWGKCAFCDGSLDYIGRYEPLTAAEIADRMELLIARTGERGFHFVDEAAPPALLRDLSLEIIRRGLTAVWWTNIRFEKSYTADLCRLMRRAGCIAVSGGLEVASDRLLRLIDKGVTVPQAAQVTSHFARAGILVHAYLMYGFPSETAQETIDSLEVVRQFFEQGLVQSGFWHRFALTAHSPVGCRPERYTVRITEPPFGGFARNDIDFTDTAGADHDRFAEGLRISLYNYMRGTGFDLPLRRWFDSPVPRTTIPPNYVERLLDEPPDSLARDGRRRVVWLPVAAPRLATGVRERKGRRQPSEELSIYTSSGPCSFRLPSGWGCRLQELLAAVRFPDSEGMPLADWLSGFDEAHPGELPRLLQHPVWKALRENGLFLL